MPTCTVIFRATTSHKSNSNAQSKTMVGTRRGESMATNQRVSNDNNDEENTRLKQRIAQLEKELGEAQQSMKEMETESTNGGKETKVNLAEKGMLGNIVNKRMFAFVPLPTDETLKAFPQIIDKCLDHLKLTEPAVRLAKRPAVEKLFKEICSNKRSYVQKQLVKKYHGKQRRMKDLLQQT